MISSTTTYGSDVSVARNIRAGRSRARVLVETGVGFGLILAAIWAPGSWRGALCFVTLGWIVAVSWSPFWSWHEAGIRVGGFLRSAWLIGAAFGLTAVAFGVASKLHTLHAPHGVMLLAEGFWGYAVWSLLQQFLLQDFFLRRLSLILPERLAVIAAASLFALAHLPNPVLTVLTFVWGVISCAIFLRYRNLFTVGIIHAMLGICVAVTVPSPIQHDMRVGLGYLHYRPKAVDHRSIKSVASS